jgi:hypothetical protein
MGKRILIKQASTLTTMDATISTSSSATQATIAEPAAGSSAQGQQPIVPQAVIVPTRTFTGMLIQAYPAPYNSGYVNQIAALQEHTQALLGMKTRSVGPTALPRQLPLALAATVGLHAG